jgi:hypothetical protein
MDGGLDPLTASVIMVSGIILATAIAGATRSVLRSIGNARTFRPVCPVSAKVLDENVCKVQPLAGYDVAKSERRMARRT